MWTSSKNENRKRRHSAIRKRIAGDTSRPRLAVFRSAKHIYAQIVDDQSSKILLAASDLTKVDGDEGHAEGKKRDRAKRVGAVIAKKCLAKGIDKVVFDRSGYKYHGRVSALADGAREAGLKF